MRFANSIVVCFLGSLTVACLGPGPAEETPAEDEPAPAEPAVEPELPTAPETPPARPAAPEAIPTESVVNLPSLAVAEGDEVIPQSLLHLSVDWPEGEVVAYRWSVAQPLGSVSLFRPSLEATEPTFEVNVAGVYEFTVTLTLASGQTANLSRMIYVVPDQALHVELLWHTPGDADETDEGAQAGTDLDLHLLHPEGFDYDSDTDTTQIRWFDLAFDCFWFNVRPSWGDFEDMHDDPALDRDDTDGAGPENVNLDSLDDERCYMIGVHYWTDNGLGPSLATVRIYVHGNLVTEIESPIMTKNQMWAVGTVCRAPAATVIATRAVCSTSRTGCESDDDCDAGETCGPDIVRIESEEVLP